MCYLKKKLSGLFEVKPTQYVVSFCHGKPGNIREFYLFSFIYLYRSHEMSQILNIIEVYIVIWVILYNKVLYLVTLLYKH